MATLGPTLEKVSNHLVKMANAFMKLSPTTQKIIIVIGGIVAAAGPLLMFIGSLMGSVGNILTMAPKIVGAIKNIGSAFSALGGFLAANPIVLIIAGIAALVVALVVLYHKSETFRNFVNGAVAAIKGVVLGVINGIKAGITGFVSAVSSAWNSLKSATTSAWNAVKNAILSVWNGIKSTTSNIWNGIKNAVGNAINGAKGFISRFRPRLPHVNNPVASLLGWVKNAINKARSIINGFRPHLPKLSFPHINLPHFKVSGGSAPWGIGGKGSLPKFSVNWYKKGGIFDSPSIIGVGEAGPEAVLPISKLEGILKKTFKPQTVLNGTVFKIYAAEGQSAEAIGDAVLNKIISLCKIQGGMISG
jgi:phage-related protein